MDPASVRSGIFFQRELGVENGPSYGGYDTSYAIEAPIASPIIVPTRVTRAGSSRAGSMPPPRRYSVSGPPSSVSTHHYRSTTPLTSRFADIETSLGSRMDTELTADEYLARPAVSMTQLRAKTTEARNKMDRHRSLLDRYLPVHMGPVNDVQYEVDYKFGELADRMPVLEPYRPNPDKAAFISRVEPYRPATKATRPQDFAAKPPSGRSLRPEVSDTRKRCRAVLCKTKGDPRYFD